MPSRICPRLQWHCEGSLSPRANFKWAYLYLFPNYICIYFHSLPFATIDTYDRQLKFILLVGKFVEVGLVCNGSFWGILSFTNLLFSSLYQSFSQFDHGNSFLMPNTEYLDTRWFHSYIARSVYRSIRHDTNILPLRESSLMQKKQLRTKSSAPWQYY